MYNIYLKFVLFKHLTMNINLLEQRWMSMHAFL